MRFAVTVLIALPLTIGAQTLPAGLNNSDWNAIQRAHQSSEAHQSAYAGEPSKLMASDAATSNYFGSVVAASGDTVIVGADWKNTQAGAAYVFVRSGNSWVQQQELVPLDPASYSYFGVSVTISGDTAVVGTLQKAPTYSGAAYVFVRNGTVWTQQQKLTAADGSALDHFGGSVALNGEGDTAVIGAAWKGYPGKTGSAYVFVRYGSTWSLQQELTGNDSVAGDLFGYSVKVTDDSIFVGAPFRKTNTGAVYVFTLSGSVWTQTQELTANDAATYTNFGDALDMSGDVLLVGADGGGAGSAYIFERGSNGWAEAKKLTASNPAFEDFFGWSVAVNGDMILVGTPRHLGFSGSVYVFLRKGNTWAQDQILNAPEADDVASNFFGWTVALTGQTPVVGAFGVSSNTGAVYVFGK